MEEYQHQLEADANPQIGPTILAEDFVLDESFVTHLPLVIIDFQGNEVRNIYSFTAEHFEDQAIFIKKLY